MSKKQQEATDNLGAYYDCERQIQVHRDMLDQMKLEGKMYHNPTQNYWTPKPGHLDEYHRLSGVIRLLESHKRLLAA